MNALQRAVFDACATLTYRRARTEEDFEEIGRLRATEYNRAEVYRSYAEAPLIDPLDRHPKAFVFGVYRDAMLVSSVRVCILTPHDREGTATVLFPDVLNPLLDQGVTFVDPSRFVASPEASRVIPGLPLITLRLAVMAMSYFNTDFCLSTVREGHFSFYRKVFHSTVLAPPRPQPGFSQDIGLLGASRVNYDKIMDGNPVFGFSLTERRLAFETISPPVLAVRPLPYLTADVA